MHFIYNYFLARLRSISRWRRSASAAFRRSEMCASRFWAAGLMSSLSPCCSLGLEEGAEGTARGGRAVASPDLRSNPAAADARDVCAADDGPAPAERVERAPAAFDLAFTTRGTTPPLPSRGGARTAFAPPSAAAAAADG